MNPPLVLVPGLQGSHLKDSSNGSRSYLSVASLLNLVSVDLHLPLERELLENGMYGKQKTDSRIPDGMIEELRLCCIPFATLFAPLVK